MTAALIGAAMNRTDGVLKVTGGARYAGDMAWPGMVHAVAVGSTIARGRVQAVHDAGAAQAPGVLAILRAGNAPRLVADAPDMPGKAGEPLLPLQDPDIHYAGQVVALVVATTLEQAEWAAGQLRFDYAPLDPGLDVATAPRYWPEMAIGETLQSERGARRAPSAGVFVEQTYTTPFESHNPMEPSACLARWAGDELTLCDTTQAVIGTRAVLAHRFGLAPAQVRVESHYVGGGFGCKGFVWHQETLAAMAARVVQRPVKLRLTRAQMFALVGHRARTVQRLHLAADREGRLTAIAHETLSTTSMIEEYVETAGLATRLLYASDWVRVSHELARLNTGTPGPMRAPGKASGLFALESALDELAHRTHLDPVALRLLNHADRHPETGRPWSSKHLKECYQRGARLFGWPEPLPPPGSLRAGHEQVGFGMATATFPGYRSPAAARIRLHADGSAEVFSATQDLGTGTYTVLAQVAGDRLGLPLSRVRVSIGASDLPPAPVSGGSQTVASVAPAVEAAALGLIAGLAGRAVADPGSPLFGRAASALTVRDGALVVAGDPSVRDPYGALLARLGETSLEYQAEVQRGSEGSEVACQSFGAHFVEVRVDPALGRVRVPRVVSVFDCGRILNPKTTHSQFVGGIVWGIGMALMEQTVYEPSGRIINDNLADYLIPVQADIDAITVDFIEVPDPWINPLGARGVGEIGITGVAAAITNAIFHATGCRIRDLPVTPDRLLHGLAEAV